MSAKSVTLSNFTRIRKLDCLQISGDNFIVKENFTSVNDLVSSQY